MDIIELLEADHREVEGMFTKYDQGHHDVVPQIVDALTLHTRIEEKILYPAMADALPDGQEEATHAKQEHMKVEEFMDELKESPNDTDAFEDLKAEVEHHVTEEERELFPKIRTVVDQARLDEMGAKAEEMKSA